jgi:hypothetical protein
MQNVTVNADQRLYVIPGGGGYSCLGFDVVRDNANHMLGLLMRRVRGQEALPLDTELPHPLYVGADERGSIGAYDKYLRVHEMWRASPVAGDTYYGPGTPAPVRKILERYRKDRERELRLWYGAPDTGYDWCSEFEVLGHIGRSCGYVKVPLLVPEGESGGGAILTACILRLMDVSTGRELYRAANYQPPKLAVCADQRRGHLPWAVERDGTVQAGFEREADAHAYVAFMHGAVTRPYYLKQ